MSFKILLKMFYILVVCVLYPVLLAAGVQTLTIDSQLGTSIEDCFERMTIGEQLPSNAIYRNVSELTTRECEQICKQDKQCQTYDYGVGAKGNATCDLSNINEQEIKEKNVLQRHPDYDVYVRRIQCQQSPPTPIQPQFDDPESDRPEGPSHRPVFRPDDEKFSNDYLVSTDLRPYGTGRPSPYRPDDYSSTKPDFDSPPSYGSHRPQDIPYRPDRPSQNQSYNQKPEDELQFQGYGPRPERPSGHYGLENPEYNYIVRPNRRPYPQNDYNKPRPDPYGQNEQGSNVLYGQNYFNHASGPIGPPDRPYRPKRPHRPNKPHEKPGHYGQYANGYGHNTQNDNSIYLEIYNPPRPYKPVDRPHYGHLYGTYGNTYSSQNSYSGGNFQQYGSITEIGGYDQNRPVDDLRPDPISHRPQKPGYSSTNEGSNGYGSKPQKPIDPYDKPYASNQGSYGSNQGSYGSSQGSSQGSYGSSQSSYGSNQGTNGSNQGPYGSNQGTYGSNQVSHGSSLGPYDNNQGITGSNQESYGSTQGSYGSTQGSYGSSQGSYGGTQRPNSNNGGSHGSYGSNHGSDSNQGSYGSNQGDYASGQAIYGSNQPTYGSSQGSYGSNQGNHGSNQGSYGGNQGSYGGNQGSYGGNQGSYGGNQGSYGGNQGSYGGSQGSYGSNRPSYSNNDKYESNHVSNSNSQSGYSSNQASYGSNQYYGSNNKPYINQENEQGYGLKPIQKPNKKPLYGGSQDSYTSNQAYGSSQESYSSTQSHYSSNQASYGSASYGSSNRPSYNEYDNNQPSYGTQKPQKPHVNPSYNNDYDSQAGYGGSQGGYGSNQGGYGSNHNQEYGNYQPSYGSNRPTTNQYLPTPSYGSENSGYDNQKPDYGSNQEKPGYGQKPGNGTDHTGYPDIKPVYEYETDKPGDVPSYIARPGGEVVTSRPMVIGDYGERPGYREPGKESSHKACFRRVLAGRRALRSHVRKAIPCERLEDCRVECAAEVRFPCESFNYRLDRTFRGKGLCELMTKPIEAFDIGRDFVEDKDYDFYELDRNSLEPNCPDTLRGAGFLHSGFLGSKSNKESEYQNRWSDRNDWYNNRYHSDYNRYYHERKGSGLRRHYEDQFFVPYQIGVGRSNDDRGSWGQYGGLYGGYDTYYKDRNDYHKSVNHWRITADTDRSYGVKPLATSVERPYGGKTLDSFDYHNLAKSDQWSHKYGYGSWKKGRWNSSGGSWNGLDYGETIYKPSHDFDGRNDDADSKDCSSRRSPGMSLVSGAIRRSLLARNVVHCEAACFSEREFKCVSYSFRYSSSHGSDNCFLSERPYRGLELSADSGSDVYAMPQDQGCVTMNYRPWVESECFWHVRSGAAVTGKAVRAALTVAGLGACEAECIRANGFFCRGFSFRFDSPTIGDDLENCVLTSSPPTSLETGRGLRPNSGHELYARGNYGRGCEPALYDDTDHRDSECYLQYDSAAKLAGPAVRGQARVKDERSCGLACTDAPFRCLSFSYNNNALPDTDNCFLSEIRLFDLQRGVDYVHSTDDWLFAFDLFNGQCWRKVYGQGDYEEPSPELPHPIPVSGPDESYPPSGPSGPGYLPESPDLPYIPESLPPSGAGYKPYPTGPDAPVYKPGYSEPTASDFKPGYPVEPTGPGYKPIRPSYKPSFPVEHSRPGYPVEPSSPDYKPIYPDEHHKPSYKPVYPDVSGPDLKPNYPYEPNIPGYKPAYSPPIGPGYLPEPNLKPGFRPPKPDRPFRPDASGGGYNPDRPGFRPERPGPQKPVYQGNKEDSEIAVSWRHYSVSGFPCRAGTSCAQNQVAGHWACEPEGGEIGSWDYCCAPTHRCGYSEGFNKPWCYVGPAEDQWRPCSEKYYPYHHHNVPHPSQGHKETSPHPPRPWHGRPSHVPDRPHAGPYLPEADRKYWDDLYKNGPQAYYDKYGNPLPGYTRVPTEDRPYIKYSHTRPRPGSGQWVPVSASQSELDPQVPGGLGVPRYWPVAYLHKSPPPNMTYFRYNETTTTIERDTPKTPTQSRELPTELEVDIDKPKGNNFEKHRDEKKRNMSDFDGDIFHIDLDKASTTVKTDTTENTPIENKDKDIVKANTSETDSMKTENVKIHKTYDTIDGIDDKLDDFSSSIEVFDIEEAKRRDKICDLKTLEAEERQIEEIGRLLASRREGKLVLEKRSQKDLESKNIAIDQDLVDFNFGNRFPTTERRGVIQKVSKDEIERDRNIDKSLEVSETTFVRPPRVLSTTENIRKAIVNGKVFYDATIREQRDIFSNSTRKSKSLRPLEDSRAPSVIPLSTFGKKKVIKPRNVNPVRRVRRVYRKRYNPDEVRRRLLERERSMKENITESSRKV